MPVVQRQGQARVTEACVECHNRKQKCDAGSPCSFCKIGGLSCQYYNKPPVKMNNVWKLFSSLEAHTEELRNVNRKLQKFDTQLQRLEQTRDVTSIRQAPESQDHRTGPHKLLRLWPSVDTLFRNAGIRYRETYVMEAEDRGVLRLYGRGEDTDDNGETQPSGPAIPDRIYELGGGTYAPAPLDNHWGTLKSDRSLDLDINTINTLYESYMTRIHVIHPFLDEARLRRLFDNFIQRYGSSAELYAEFIVDCNGSDTDRPFERQQSYSGKIGVLDDMSLQSIPTERSPSNAIFYLVLALGKICMHRDPLPAIPAKNRLSETCSRHHLTGHSGMTSSSPIPTAPESSPKETRSNSETISALASSRSGPSSIVRATNAGARNLDIIPGLAYYTKAVEILRDQGHANQLAHAQMFLLAGLYKGQLNRVKESMSWYAMAGRVCKTLLERYKLLNDKYWTTNEDVERKIKHERSLIKDRQHNLIVIASWSCLQFESDILAELPLPSSGIIDIENQLLMPHALSEPEVAYQELDRSNQVKNNDKIMIYYVAQTFLRMKLNQIHRELYGPDCLSDSLESVRETLRSFAATLDQWRAELPEPLRWKDTDPPSTDILNAKLRGKFWDAQYVANRPCLDYALHIMPSTMENRRVCDVALDVYGNPRHEADVHLFEAIQGMDESEMWKASQRCLEAAMQSTVAFDGVPHRLIVTNIHGTAHAQFGNMLVLSAAYSSNFTIVPKDSLQSLLERTIIFLRYLSPSSPTSIIDCHILEEIHRSLFEPSSDIRLI